MNAKNLHTLGIDIGSTTVKIAILNDENEVLFSDYERHFANIQETLSDLLGRALYKLGPIQVSPVITGSGGLTLAKHLGVPFVQEVIAVSTALQDYAPQTDVAIELGGEDAKIIYFEGGNVEQRMNGVCAGGTGSFIDQMASLLQTDASGLNEYAKNYKALYSIAARCGVFAKTDIQPLINDGAAKEDSRENEEKPDRNVPAEETESKQPKNSSVTEHEVPTKHNETYRNDNGKQEISKEETAASETIKSAQDTLDQTDTKDESGQKEEAEERYAQEPEKVPKMFTEVKGKPVLSDEWIAYMFEHHPKRFTAWFNRFASKQQKERYYLNTHVPKISVIMNDILYDTEKAEQYLAEEKDIRDGKMKVFYYRMPAGYFFKILSIMGRSDELVTMEKKDVKKLLGKRPDIYRKIIPDEIKE